MFVHLCVCNLKRLNVFRAATFLSKISPLCPSNAINHTRAQPFLNYWKTHKTYNTYLIFFTSFAICRIVWVPIFAYNTYMIHLNGQFDYLIYPTVVFYLLQLAWFGKMIQMLWNYKSPEEIEKERHQVKKD